MVERRCARRGLVTPYSPASLFDVTMEERTPEFVAAEASLRTGRTRTKAVMESAMPTPKVGHTPSPARIRRPGEHWDVFRISFDRSSGLVRAYAAGTWTIDETRHYLASLKAFVTDSRLSLGKARVLLDRREVSAQSPDVAALLAAANGEIFAADDRIAIVVTTSMAKLGLRQRLPHPGSKAFLSIDAAETWLQAFEKRS
jgi:hypothetical protein